MISSLLMSSLISLSPAIECNGPGCSFLGKEFVVVEIRGDISEGTPDFLRSQIQQAVTNKQPFIPVLISSYGGSVYALLEMIDIFKAVKLPILTYVEGKAMSAGSVLLSMGTEGMRWCSPNSTVMIHEVSSGMGGKLSEMNVSVEEARRLNQLILEVLSKNIGKEKDWAQTQILARSHLDWFLTAKEAKEINICNYVGIPEITIEVQIDVKVK